VGLGSARSRKIDQQRRAAAAAAAAEAAAAAAVSASRSRSLAKDSPVRDAKQRIKFDRFPGSLEAAASVLSRD